jgi:uncharacterized LabA/DUF88 family protein
MIDTNKTIVLIDEGYLSKIKKHFGGGNYIKCHVNQLAIRLSKERNLWCDEVYFYTAPPYQSPIPTEEEKERKRNYDKFIQKLKYDRLTPIINIKEGRCQKDKAGKFYQKGVDTHLIMDLMSIAQRREVKQIILLACDTDFIPIIEKVKKDYGLKVILACFFDRKRKSNFSMSNHILTACDDKIFIRREHFDTTPIYERS